MISLYLLMVLQIILLTFKIVSSVDFIIGVTSYTAN